MDCYVSLEGDQLLDLNNSIILNPVMSKILPKKDDKNNIILKESIKKELDSLDLSEENKVKITELISNLSISSCIVESKTINMNKIIEQLLDFLSDKKNMKGSSEMIYPVALKTVSKFLTSKYNEFFLSIKQIDPTNLPDMSLCFMLGWMFNEICHKHNLNVGLIKQNISEEDKKKEVTKGVTLEDIMQKSKSYFNNFSRPFRNDEELI